MRYPATFEALWRIHAPEETLAILFHGDAGQVLVEFHDRGIVLIAVAGSGSGEEELMGEGRHREGKPEFMGEVEHDSQVLDEYVHSAQRGIIAG